MQKDPKNKIHSQEDTSKMTLLIRGAGSIFNITPQTNQSLMCEANKRLERLKERLDIDYDRSAEDSIAHCWNTVGKALWSSFGRFKRNSGLKRDKQSS